MTRCSSFFLLLLSLALSGCGTVPAHDAVPELLVSEAQVEGFPADVRSWADEPTAGLAGTIERRIAKYQEANADYFKEHKEYPAMNYLALSGGANNGAFAAGILYGWSKAGTRPEFTIVTGTSTGALIAPFAFLGPKYDEVLKREYTTISTDNIYHGDLWTVMHGITGGMSLVDNTPLKERMDELVTPELMREIGGECAKGRRLLIGTTNLEAQRGVIWNICNVVESANADSIALFKKILLASAAVPGIFEPVFIDVIAGGKHYQEMHVDGGVTSQVFLFPLKSSRLDRDAFADSHIARNLYIIRNAKISPDYKALAPLVYTVSGRSVETLIKYQSIGDLYRLYAAASRDGMNYRLLYIPPEFKEQSSEMFDKAYMLKVFELGEKMTESGDPWMKAPPGIDYAD